MTMALLNYSNPFLGAATPAPFYGSPLALHHNVQQPSVLYGQQPLNQFNANSPYRRSEPPSQYQTQRNSVYIDQRHQYNNQQRSFPPNFKSSSYQNQGEPVREALRSHQQPTTPANVRTTTESNSQRDQRNPVEQPGSYPLRPIKYERVDPDAQKTSIHPIIDYDGDYEYYDDDEGNPVRTPLVTHVTPIQGPIFIKNGTVPVVPLYSYPVLNNGTFVQIPILWTALQVALGLELRGEIIRGVPCIKRYHQLFCPTAGNSYPIDKIELFIDENKALMKRMYGDFSMRPSGFGPPGGGRKKRRSGPGDPTRDPPGVPDLHSDPSADPFGSSDATGNGESYFSKLRKSRQSSAPNPPFRNNQSNESGRLDACESKVEIVTPYWASNSAGKIRAIVNTQHFEQAIHQEVCSKMRTNRCSGDCGCEQKYKWHRLLAYDPDNDCKGIFMDWFLFPSCCVCRCDPN